jgi:hypothetical protein
MENENFEKREIEEIKKMSAENLRLNKEMMEKINKINRFVFWQRIFGVLKFVIILIPLILGVIYLPPLIENLLIQYKQVLDLGGLLGN